MWSSLSRRMRWWKSYWKQIDCQLSLKTKVIITHHSVTLQFSCEIGHCYPIWHGKSHDFHTNIPKHPCYMIVIITRESRVESLPSNSLNQINNHTNQLSQEMSSRFYFRLKLIRFKKNSFWSFPIDAYQRCSTPKSVIGNGFSKILIDCLNLSVTWIRSPGHHLKFDVWHMNSTLHMKFCFLFINFVVKFYYSKCCEVDVWRHKSILLHFSA